jgi:septal ring factor EnvC (AmiA/AmiB activator)
VKIAADAKTASGIMVVQEDPRIEIIAGDRVRLSDAIMRVYALQKSADAARKNLQSLRTQITTLQNSLKETPDVSKQVNDSVQKLLDELTTIQKKLVATPDTSGSAGPALPDEPRPLISQIGGVAAGLDSYTAAPTADELVRIDDLSKQLRVVIGEVNKLVDEGVANLNKQLRESGFQFLNPGKRVEPAQ